MSNDSDSNNDNLFQPDEDGGYELVIPFIPIQSEGGPFDDGAYAAGYEMGRLDVVLSTASNLGLTPDTHYLCNEHNAEQVDLLAMRYGFSCLVEPVVATDWISVTFTAIVPNESE